MAKPTGPHIRLVRAPLPPDRPDRLGSEPFEWRWQHVGDAGTVLLESPTGWIRRDHAITQARKWVGRKAGQAGPGGAGERLAVWAPPVRKPEGDLELVE